MGDRSEGTPDLSLKALEALNEYAFPGNVRELENVLERALAMCENNVIRTEDLGLQLAPDEMPADVGSQPGSSISSMTSLLERERHALIQALEKTRWNKKAAAKLLGITYRQLRYKVEKLDL